jgi:hypothetical protein
MVTPLEVGPSRASLGLGGDDLLLVRSSIYEGWLVIMTIVQSSLFGGETVVKAGRRVERPRETVLKVLHFGAGVQSSAIAEMIIAGELSPVDVVLFADTGNEPKYVYDQVAAVSPRLAAVGIELITVRRPGPALLDHAWRGEGKFVSLPLFTKSNTGAARMIQRQCTAEYKIVPCDNFTLDRLLSAGHAFISNRGNRRIVRQGVQVENVYGISYDEFYRAGKRGPNWQKAVYPLISARLTRNDCIRWFLDHGLPVPKKSSCKICPYHSNSYWLDLKQSDPTGFDECCAFDEYLRSSAGKKRFKASMAGELWLHSACRPLRSIDFSGTLDLPLFRDSLCGDHCMT